VPSRRSIVCQLMLTSLIVGCKAPTLQPLQEDEVVARSLGFKSDATAVDAKAFPNFVPGQHCALCHSAQRTDAAALGCSVFPGRSVPEQAWCARFERAS
jgi:High potential iron-sulfur protein